MKTLTCIVLALGALAVLPARSHARSETYVLAGPVLADLRADAVRFGRDVAVGLDQAAGGDWRSRKSTRLGPIIGLGWRTGGEEGVRVALELDYGKRGAKYEFTDASGTYRPIRSTFKFDALQIPVLLEIEPPNDSSVNAIVSAGPVICINRKAEFATDSGGAGPTAVPANVKDTSLGGLVGAGVRVRATHRSSVVVQARFTLGMTQLLKDGSGYDLKNQELSLVASYAFEP